MTGWPDTVGIWAGYCSGVTFTAMGAIWPFGLADLAEKRHSRGK